jgi:hypothetical protein
MSYIYYGRTQLYTLYLSLEKSTDVTYVVLLGQCMEK